MPSSKAFLTVIFWSKLIVKSMRKLVERAKSPSLKLFFARKDLIAFNQVSYRKAQKN
jgi:hypothetical protein